MCAWTQKEANQCRSNLFDIRFRWWKLESPGSPLHCVGFYSWQVGQALTVRMTLMSAFHSPATRGYVFRTIRDMATPVSVVLDLWWGSLPYYYCCPPPTDTHTLYHCFSTPPILFLYDSITHVSLICSHHQAEHFPHYRSVLHFLEIKDWITAKIKFLFSGGTDQSVPRCIPPKWMLSTSALLVYKMTAFFLLRPGCSTFYTVWSGFL